MKNILILACIPLLFLAGCTPDSDVPVSEDMKVCHFTASFDSDATRATLESGKVNWVKGDAISIFDGVSNVRSEADAAGLTAGFSASLKAADKYYALYPYDSDASLSNGSVFTYLPEVQDGDFAKASLSVALSTSRNELKFKNVLSLFCFSIGDDGVKDVKITSDAVIAGDLKVDASAPKAAVSGDRFSKTVTLSPKGGIVKGKVYYVCVLPGTHDLEFRFTKTDESYAVLTAKGFEARRNTVYEFGVFSEQNGLVYEKPGQPTGADYVRIEENLDDWTGKYLIVNEDAKCALDGSLADPDANGNFFAVTISDGKIIGTDETDARCFTIEETDGGYTVKSESGLYIGALSNSNTIDFSKSVEYVNQVSYSGGSAVVKGSGGAYLRYNAGVPMFRYYKSSSYANQQPIQLYRLEGSPGARKKLQTPEGLSVDTSGKVSWTAVENAGSYLLTIGGDENEVTETSFKYAGEDGYFDISLVAVPADITIFKPSDPATLKDARFGNPSLDAPALKLDSADDSSVTVTWELDHRASNGYRAEIRLKGGKTALKAVEDIEMPSVTFSDLEELTEYTVTVSACAVESPKYDAVSSSIDVATLAGTHISDVTEAGSYSIRHMAVFAKPDANTAIVNDKTGYMLVYSKSSLSVSVEDEIFASGNVVKYNGVWEFQNASVTKTGTAEVSRGSAAAADGAYLSSYASAPSIVYVSLKGAQDGGFITVDGKKLSIGSGHSSTDGMSVLASGYLYGYDSSAKTFSFCPLDLKQDTTVPSLSIDASSKTWEWDGTSAFTVNVTATNGSWTVSPATLDWASVTADTAAGRLTVTPSGPNETGTDRSASLVITHSADKSLQKTVSLSQKCRYAPAVTTVQASSVSEDRATLNASFVNGDGLGIYEPRFVYGTSASNLNQTEYYNDGGLSGKTGTYSVTVEGLKPGTTYYFKAILQIGSADYEGEVLSFKTSGSSASTGTPGWFELPRQKDADHDGIDDDNSDFYYSWTMRADASKIRNFSSCYSKSRIHPYWVAAPMHKCYLGSSGRNDSYKNDPAIKCTQSPKFDGYTRGHMIGSSDRTVSVATNKQVFYYSNIGAQLQSGFNTGGGVWNNLEDRLDSYMCSDTLYQVVGCIFDTFTDKYGTTVNAKTGTNSVGTFQVPTAWYKVLLRTKSGKSGKRVDQCTADELQCVAFIVSHKGSAGRKPSKQDMYSVEYVEELTGLEFFVNVPNAPKSTFSASDWGF